jgi:phage-related protein
MNWNLLVTGPAQKQLRRIPERDREQVEAALLAMQGRGHAKEKPPVSQGLRPGDAITGAVISHNIAFRGRFQCPLWPEIV